MSVSIPKIKKKNTLKSFDIENSVITAIVADTVAIPNHFMLRADLELIRRICCLIENMIVSNNKNSPKLDKKEMVVKIFKLVFPTLTAEEVIVIQNHIQYLWNNNRIKAIPIVKKVAKGIFSWLKKKVV